MPATGNTTGWRPLLQGDGAERVWQSIFELSGAMRGLDTSRTYGIHGPALFYSYLSAARDDAEVTDVAMGYVDQALEALATEPMGPPLYGGFAGLAWTVQHLEGRLYEADEDDDGEEVDELLLDFLQQESWTGFYDLISGLVGFAVYGLERLSWPGGRRCVELTIDRLADLAEKDGEGITWFTPPRLMPPHHRQDSPEGYYNLGVAHGVPGVIAVLAEACAAGVAPEKAGPLLEGAVDWLLSHEITHSAGCFGTTTAAAEAGQPCRLAWCYGDAGVAAALLLAARRHGRQDWEEHALRIALLAAKRTSLDETGVIDAGLCHGAAGLGHLFNRLYHATGEEILASTARHWYLAALELRRPGEGVAGYLSFEPGPDGVSAWRAVSSFLTGAAGVGLALLGAVTPIEPEWDRVLLSSIPPRI